MISPQQPIGFVPQIPFLRPVTPQGGYGIVATLTIVFVSQLTLRPNMNGTAYTSPALRLSPFFRRPFTPSPQTVSEFSSRTRLIKRTQLLSDLPVPVPGSPLLLALRSRSAAAHATCRKSMAVTPDCASIASGW